MDLSIEESEYTLKIIVMVLLTTVNNFKNFKKELVDKLESDEDKSLFGKIVSKLTGYKPKISDLDQLGKLEEFKIGTKS